jgi:acyl dehydratase
MPTVPLRFVAEQVPVIRAVGRTALTVLKQRGRAVAAPGWAVPGPVITETLPPRSRDLVDTYLRHLGANASAYRGTLPPHLFPQWTFEPLSRTLAGAPYPLDKAMNGGCRYDQRCPIPVDEPLTVEAQLVSVDDDGRRAILTQRVVTGTPSAPEALVAELFAFVPLAKGEKRAKKAPVVVPLDAREVAFWRVGDSAGLDFALLTGDFNPIHWIGPYARAAGFRNTILHGFGTLARAVEGVHRAVYVGAAPVTGVEARFLKPLVLPARVGLYVGELDGNRRKVWVGDAAGGAAYMEATFTTASSG